MAPVDWLAGERERHGDLLHGGRELGVAQWRGRAAGAEPDDEDGAVGVGGLAESDARGRGVVARARRLLDAVDADQQLFVAGDVDRVAIARDSETGEHGLRTVGRDGTNQQRVGAAGGGKQRRVGRECRKSRRR